MGSSIKLWRSVLMSRTWLQMLPNTFIFSDAKHESVPQMMTLPEIENKKDYNDAQHRQLQGMLWMRQKRPDLLEKKWFIFADDDTWMNVPVLLNYLYVFNENLPMAIGFVWDRVWNRDWATISGGSGFALSREAFHIVSAAIYGPQPLCEFQSLNDITLSRCMHANQVLMIHSDKFTWIDVGDVNDKLIPSSYLNKISFHYSTNPVKIVRMTCDSIAYWDYRESRIPSECTGHKRAAQLLSFKNDINPVQRSGA